MKKAFAALAASTVLFSAANANAAVYTSVRDINGATATLSITTDDTIGVLTDANILDWTIGLNEGGDSFTLFGPLSGGNSELVIQGSALSATATDLIFDFDAASGLALFQTPSVGSGEQFYCVQVDGCFDFFGPGEGLAADPNFAFERAARSGQVVIASTAVPEASTWAMMLMGVGAIGGALRTRRKASVSVSYA
jgi:hypothetical protein